MSHNNSKVKSHGIGLVLNESYMSTVEELKKMAEAGGDYKGVEDLPLSNEQAFLQNQY